jgi:fructosamine-3-kinase
MLNFEELEPLLERAVSEVRPRAGGDAAEAFDVRTDDGTWVFVKTVSSGSPFFMEAQGLERLRTEKGVRVPQVLAVSDRFLVLERITFGTPRPDFQ